MIVGALGSTAKIFRVEKVVERIEHRHYEVEPCSELEGGEVSLYKGRGGKFVTSYREHLSGQIDACDVQSPIDKRRGRVTGTATEVEHAPDLGSGPQRQIEYKVRPRVILHIAHNGVVDLGQKAEGFSLHA